MHIVLGFLTTLVTVLYLLDRLGINLGGLNPFYWRRRRAWARKYQGDPIYAVEDPMEIAALLVAGTAKLDGEITAEQKAAMLAEFSSQFSLSDREASQLLTSSTHLLGQPQIISTQLEGLLSRQDKTFSAAQAESVIQMMSRVLDAGPAPTAEQQALIASVSQRLSTPAPRGGTWA